MFISGTLTFTLIFCSGFLPALLWLWLILKEDRVHPEPRMRLVLSFLGGMAGVLAVLPLQIFIVDNLNFGQPTLTIVLAATEEITKFLFCFFIALHTKDTDEPIDEVIYLAATALGFAALENSLFLTTPLISGQLGQGLAIANARFLGSTLVHVVSSGTIGIFLAGVFYKKDKFFAVLCGLVIAVALHASYNLLIIDGNRYDIALAFSGLWTACLVLLYVVNCVKHMVYKTTT